MSLDEQLRASRPGAEVDPPGGAQPGPNRQPAALVAWRAFLTLGTLLRRWCLAVMGAVQRVEEVAVPALLRLGRAVPRSLERAERVLVPLLPLAGRGILRGVDRVETRLVPALGAGAARAAVAFGRGTDALAVAARSTGRGLVDGVQWTQAHFAPALSPRIGTGRGALLPPVEWEHQPGTAQLRRPTPPRAEQRARYRSAGLNLAGLAATAGIVVLAVSLTLDATVPNAAREAGGAVDVELRLPPDPQLAPLTERSYVYAANGQELQVLDREENRRLVDLAAIPVLVQQAVLTAEDQRFYTHEGYDVGGIGRAFVANVEAGDITQGGSTITQQLAKSAVGADRTLGRKFEELAYAVALERRFSKEQLLEQYLNQVYFGENAYGVAAAAEEYFGVADVAQLTVEQGALLAAMIREPNNANPRTDPATATRRRNVILDQMVLQGLLAQESADYSKSLPLGVLPDLPRVRPYDFIADSVIREFVAGPEFAAFGATPEERERALFFGGLRIYSSLDPGLQDIAQDVIRQNFPNSTDPGVMNGAVVTVEPATGRILAAHSGLDYGVEQLAIATQGRRQIGSAAKPFVYAQALREGFPPGIQLNGAGPAFYENIPGWDREDGGVQNYGNASYGILDMPAALRSSVNTAAVQLSMMVGIDDVVGLMGEMGIDTQAATEGQIGPALALGGFQRGVTPVEMAGAYATFANGGVHVRPHFIDRIEDRRGNRLYESQVAGQQVLSPEVNATMVSMMQGVVTGGTGTAAQIDGWQVAGKTGTTSNQNDAWFVGYTPTLSTAMWVGVPRESRSVDTTGAGLPTRVWGQYMTRVLAGRAPVAFPSVAVPNGRPVAGEPVSVPNVTGARVEDALLTLGSARLVAQVQQVPTPFPAGSVVGQSVAGGTTVTTGDTVVLNVSTGGAPPPPPG